MCQRLGAAALRSADRATEPSLTGAKPDGGREKGGDLFNYQIKAFPMPSALRCGAVMPSRCQCLSDESTGPGNGSGTAADAFRSSKQCVRSCLNFIPLFLDEVHLLQAAGLCFFVVIRCVVQTLCRITIIRRKRISYNMAQRGGLWVV